MRICVRYKTEEIPVAYNMMISSLIKNSIKSVDSEYYEKVYMYNNKKSKKSKNFCFAVTLSDFKLEGEIFKINDNVSVLISSPDIEFLIKLYNGLLKTNEFKYKDFILKRQRVIPVREKNVTGNEVLFRTLSPLYIRNKDNKTVSPDMEEFEEELNYVSNISLQNYRGFGLKQKLKFKPVIMEKQVVKEEISEFCEKSNKKYMFINAYKGEFILQGEMEDLNDIYKLGVSFRRNQGFGCIEPIDWR